LKDIAGMKLWLGCFKWVVERHYKEHDISTAINVLDAFTPKELAGKTSRVLEQKRIAKASSAPK